MNITKKTLFSVKRHVHARTHKHTCAQFEACYAPSGLVKCLTAVKALH